MQRPKASGGLGVDDMIMKNAAMLFKWWWRFACEEGALWKEVVSSIHKEGTFILPSITKSPIPGPWRAIKQLAAESSPVQNAFVSNLGIKLGDGARTKFWHDPWMQNSALKGRYPLLYNVSSQKKALVAEMGWFEGNTWRWTLSWGRELTEEEE